MTAKTASTSSASAAECAFSPLAYPMFRAVWIATVASSIGTWIQDIGNSWLMTSLSPSPLVVSLVQAATSLPMFLLALPAGALADLVDRRRLLLFTQAWMSIVALSLGILTLIGMTTPPVLLLFAFLIGAGSAMNSPAFQAVVPELVPQSELPLAVSLNSMGTNLARAIGPAIGGFLIAGAGPGAAFMLGASALWALFPLIARREMGLGPAGYGSMLMCMGGGAFAAVFVLPRLRNRLSPDRVILIATLIFAGATIAVGTIRRPLILAPALLFAGAAWVGGLSTLSIAAQRSAPPWARARALACYLVVWFGTITVASTLWGAIAGRFGTRSAMLTSAGVLMFGSLAGIRFRLDRFVSLNLMPAAAWPAPQIAMTPDPDAGPVLVQVEYHVSEMHIEQFVLAMRDVRGERPRDGAVSWGLYRDLSEPNRIIESFVIESWLEHMRHGSTKRLASAVGEGAMCVTFVHRYLKETA
jgi:predicted MFS family arabinose efflux permease